MQELKNNIYKEFVVFVDNLRDLESISGLAKKKLCIAKTDFKDLYLIKRFNKKFPSLEIWLSSNEVNRKNILLANANGVKKVIPYPVDMKMVEKFFNKTDKSLQTVPQIDNYASIKGMKVMVVDDNQMNVDLLGETLAVLGVQITSFIKPIEAAKAAREEKFDLFLLDIMMPEMSGFELAEIIKHTKLNSNATMVFISALSDSENKIASFNLGSAAYIEKPFDVAVVRSQIYNLLKTKRLEEALKDKKETFLSMVAHDLKTPIYAEICALELLNKNPDNMDGLQKEILTDILNAAKYMKNLVENLTHKYNSESDTLVLKKSLCSIKNIVISCIEDTKYLFEERNLKYILNCSNANYQAMMDEIEIKRVIHNLIMNAIEHGIRKSKVIMDLKESSQFLIFSITNFGIGLDVKQSDDIFKKYITCTEKHKKVNSGLGLYIAKRIIEAHGGHIKVESEINKYVRFVFTIPKV